MAKTSYTYAVARIRSKELSLLTDADMNNLIAKKNYDECIDYIKSKGWGNGDTRSGDEILSYESTKTRTEVEELISEKELLDILYVDKEFHNLKAAVKQVISQDKASNVFFDNIGLEPEELKRIIEKRDFSALPVYMREVAMDACDTLLQTKDGQLCDIIIDKATLERISAVGKNSNSEFVRKYAETIVEIANIRIAVRSAKTEKNIDFMKKSMVECNGFNIFELMEAAESVDGICAFFESKGMGDISKAVKESPSAFEKWCDNRIIESIKSQKTNPFSEGPVLAYKIARENEIKNVRIILTGKINNLSDEFIRERIRNMYV